MKVQEILIQEGTILDVLKYPFVKMLGPMLRYSAAEKAAAERLVATWAKEIEETGSITTRASKIVGKEMAKDTDLMAKAEKAAAKAAKDAKYAKDAEAFSSAMGGATQTAIKWASRIGYAVPVASLANHVRELNAQLNKGDITPEQYNKNLQFYLGECVTQLAAIKIAGGLVNTGAKIINSVDILPFSGSFANLIFKMQPAAKAGFGLWLATPGIYGGNEHFHQWFIGNTFLPEVAKFARDWLGSWAKNAWDIVADKAHEYSNGVIPNSPGNPRSDPNNPNNPANQPDIDLIPAGKPPGWDDRTYDSNTGQFK